MANITLPTIGGPFTAMIAYFPPMIIRAGTSAAPSCSGWVGSGAGQRTDTAYTDNGSSQWLNAPSSNYNNFSQGRKVDHWTSATSQGNYKVHDYSLGSCEPFNGWEFTDVQDNPTPSFPPFPIDFNAFYDNEFDTGEGGGAQNAVRNSTSWITVENQPGPPNARPLSVKGYSANQIQFGPSQAGVPLSSFNSIKARSWSVNPLTPADQYTNTVYEEAYDCYQHYDNGGTVEIMFWTYNHLQNPASIGPFVETVMISGIPWDLYVSSPTLAGGGTIDNHPYGIFYLQPAYQGDSIGWVNIRQGMRYFCSRYVKSVGTQNPLDLPLWQITHGWEVVNTNFRPTTFRMLDYKLVIT
jgi:hypothetical protein